MNYILFDDDARLSLLPSTHTRPVGDIRIGILKISEKWEKNFNSSFSYLTDDYLSEKFRFVSGNDNILINGSILPNDNLVAEIRSLKSGEALVKDTIIIAG